MAALTLRGASDPIQVARALDVRGHTIAEYFIDEGPQAAASRGGAFHAGDFLFWMS